MGFIKLRSSLSWTQTPNVLGDYKFTRDHILLFFIGSSLVDSLSLYNKSQNTQIQVQAQPILWETGNDLFTDNF